MRRPEFRSLMSDVLHDGWASVSVSLWSSAKTAPTTLQCFSAMLSSIPDTLAGTRDRASLLVGFAGALRRTRRVGSRVSGPRDFSSRSFKSTCGPIRRAAAALPLQSGAAAKNGPIPCPEPPGSSDEPPSTHGRSGREYALGAAPVPWRFRSYVLGDMPELQVAHIASGEAIDV